MNWGYNMMTGERGGIDSRIHLFRRFFFVVLQRQALFTCPGRHLQPSHRRRVERPCRPIDCRQQQVMDVMVQQLVLRPVVLLVDRPCSRNQFRRSIVLVVEVLKKHSKLNCFNQHPTQILYLMERPLQLLSRLACC